MDSNNRNNRELSAAEYFIQIQKEYLLAEFRSKIYFSPKDKRYWKKVMGFKASKIKSIATRNRLQSILNNEEKLREFHNRLFDENEKPKFTLSPEDSRNYFTAGNEFLFNGEIYTLDAINDDGKLQLFSPKKQVYETALKEDVCRVIKNA